MTQSSAQLEQEVESKRADVERSLEALKSKMSLGQIVDEVGDYIQVGQAKNAARNVGRQVRDNPLALGLIGAGLAWLMLGDGVRDRAGQYWDDDEDDRFDNDFRDPIADPAAPRKGPTRPVVSSTYSPDSASALHHGTGSSSFDSDKEGFGDKAKHAVGSARDKMGSAAGTVGDAAASAKDRAAALASGAGDTLHGAYASTRQSAHDLSDAAWDSGRRARRMAAGYSRGARHAFTDALQNEPLIVGAFAVAIGAAIGASLPATRTEDEWLGRERDRLADEAVDYAKSVKDEAVAVAEKTYHSASEKARDEGLTRGTGDKTIAEKVENVAKAATDTAKSEIDKRV